MDNDLPPLPDDDTLSNPDADLPPLPTDNPTALPTEEGDAPRPTEGDEPGPFETTINEEAKEAEKKMSGLRERWKAEEARFAAVTDTEHWQLLTFETRQQAEAWAAHHGLETENRYHDGTKHARAQGIELEPATHTPKVGKPDRKLRHLIPHQLFEDEALRARQRHDQHQRLHQFATLAAQHLMADHTIDTTTARTIHEDLTAALGDLRLYDPRNDEVEPMP